MCGSAFVGFKAEASSSLGGTRFVVTNYIDLHAHSTFSSAMTAGDAHGTPQQMVDRAVELGWSAVSLTDHGWLGGAPALYKAAKKAGIKPIIGCAMYVTPDYLHGVRCKEE